jgi:hypothetical protein
VRERQGGEWIRPEVPTPRKASFVGDVKAIPPPPSGLGGDMVLMLEVGSGGIGVRWGDDDRIAGFLFGDSKSFLARKEESPSMETAAAAAAAAWCPFPGDTSQRTLFEDFKELSPSFLLELWEQSHSRSVLYSLSWGGGRGRGREIRWRKESWIISWKSCVGWSMRSLVRKRRNKFGSRVGWRTERGEEDKEAVWMMDREWSKRVTWVCLWLERSRGWSWGDGNEVPRCPLAKFWKKGKREERSGEGTAATLEEDSGEGRIHPTRWRRFHTEGSWLRLVVEGLTNWSPDFVIPTFSNKEDFGEVS